MEAVEAQCFIQMPDQKNLRINNQTPDCAADGAGVAASAAKARRAAPVRGIAESLGTRDASHGIRCSRVALCRAPTNPRACAQPRLGSCEHSSSRPGDGARITPVGWRTWQTQTTWQKLRKDRNRMCHQPSKSRAGTGSENCVPLRSKGMPSIAALRPQIR